MTKVSMESGDDPKKDFSTQLQTESKSYSQFGETAIIQTGRHVKSMENYRVSMPENNLKAHKKLKKKARKHLNQTVQGMS